MLKVIEGSKKEKLNKHNLYYKAYVNTLEDYNDNPNQDLGSILKKLVFLGLRSINSKPDSKTAEELHHDFKFISVIRNLMANLTPLEFINLFPITKEFKGDRNQTKDYFYTMDYIKNLPADKPIGTEIDHFLWEYINHDTTMFMIKQLAVASDLRRLDGQPGLMEQWCAKNGIKTYAMHSDEKGKRYLHDPETGKAIKVKRKMPRYLRPLKAGDSKW